MQGFRPSFYNEDAALQSIEILAWAVKQPCFTIMDAKSFFEVQLEGYRDPDHEISERLRKLLKSGMLVIAEHGALDTQEAIMRAKAKEQEQKERELQAQGKKIPQREEDPIGTITLERLLIIKQFLSEIENNKKKRGRGRPPRLYFTTQAAAKYVESRADDLAAIAKTRKAKK